MDEVEESSSTGILTRQRVKVVRVGFAVVRNVFKASKVV
jgi:hypothetical protein